MEDTTKVDAKKQPEGGHVENHTKITLPAPKKSALKKNPEKKKAYSAIDLNYLDN
jgi:hypothetical protein